MSERSGPSVLIVGAGPVGLVLACELARRQVPIRVIDRQRRPTDESRAIVVHARSLEMLERIGVVDEVIASGVRTTAMDVHAAGRVIARVRLDSVDSPYKFSVTTAQTETERILTERLADLGVAIERGTELISFEQDDAGVQAILRSPDGGTEISSSSWIAGTDGAHSTVRDGMGLRLVGQFHGETFLLGDVDAEHDLPVEATHAFMSVGEGSLLVFPMRGSRVRLIAEVTGDDPEVAAAASLERLQHIVDQRARGIRLTRPHWITTFEIHHAQVPDYRVGRAFLAGDAAHIHSPAGGQGMNTGMQDAFNLGWKLALASGGADCERLLDSYQAERHPIGARVVATTTRITRLATVHGRTEQALRNHIISVAPRFPPVAHVVAEQSEETGLNYRESPVVVGRRSHAGARAHLHPGDIAPDVSGTDLRHLLVSGCTGHTALYFPDPHGDPALELGADGVRRICVGTPPPTDRQFDAVLGDTDGRISHRYGLRRGGVVLVRPDGYIGCIGAAGDSDAVDRYLELVS